MAVHKALCVGSLIVCGATFAAAMAMFKVPDAMKPLRVSEQGEFDEDRPLAHIRKFAA